METLQLVGERMSMSDHTILSEVEKNSSEWFLDHNLTTDSSMAVVSYWQKYMHSVLVKGLGGLSLPRNSVSRFTDDTPMNLVKLTGL